MLDSIYRGQPNRTSPMELRYLKTLVAIADHGGFAAAGDAIGLTQSAISLHVKAMEAELGIKLFDRSRRPPILNPQGSALLSQAREITRLCSQLKDAVSEQPLSGVLELGAIATVLTGVLPAALVTMQKTHPRLLIKLTSGLSGELAGQIYKGQLDVAIVAEPIQLATGLSWHPFVRESLVVIAPIGTQGETDRELLESWPFIRFKRHAWAGQLIDSRLQDRGINVKSSMEVDSLEAISVMVAHGLGVSVVPQRLIDTPFPPNLKVLPFGDPPVQRVVGLIERTSNPKTHLVKALYQILLKLSGNAEFV